MILTGTYTQAGQALATRFLAGGTLTLTRIAAGSGKTSLSAAHMDREEQDLGLCSPTLEGRTALLRCTLNTTQAHASYSLTELGVYASDGEDEVLYLLYSLDQPFPVDPAARVVLRFNLEQTLADGASVTIDAPLDGLVSQEDLDGKADLVSGQVPYAQTPHLTANVTLYVDAAAGSDANPGTQQAPFQTIQAAIDSLPKDLGGFIATINVAEGEYLEDVVISGFHNGAFSSGVVLNGDTAVSTTRHINSLTVACNSCEIVVTGFYATGNKAGASVIVTNTVFAVLKFINATYTATAHAGIYVGAWGAANVLLNSCTVSGYTTGVAAMGSSVVSINAGSISNCTTGIMSGYGNNGTGAIVMIVRSVTYSGNTTNTATLGGSQIFGEG